MDCCCLHHLVVRGGCHYLSCGQDWLLWRRLVLLSCGPVPGHSLQKALAPAPLFHSLLGSPSTLVPSVSSFLNRASAPALDFPPQDRTSWRNAGTEFIFLGGLQELNSFFFSRFELWSGNTSHEKYKSIICNTS